eukprot:TRINITY_DN15019_c0_g2_i1.p1 TRINITY_DN15019_c0_g2~~TRINITY_DN15019_c0_g2_i1.p1  ORF type:complete len:1049 (-),score=159.63 TRINITY_DN15019_c0_g2_i1:226-3372(-)
MTSYYTPRSELQQARSFAGQGARSAEQRPGAISFYARDARLRNRTLRDQLRGQPDSEGILRLVEDRGEFWDAIGVTTALHAIAWKVRAGAMAPDFACDSRWLHLRQLLSERLPTSEARSLSNSAWALAAMACSDRPLLEELSGLVFLRTPEFKQQELSNTCWAFATVRYRNDPLLELLATELVSKSVDGSAQDLANSLWSFAALACLHVPLFHCLCNFAVDLAPDFKPQECANCMWAMAIATFNHDSLTSVISRRAVCSLSEFRTQNLSNFVWAYAKLGHSEGFVLQQVQAAMLQKLGNCSAQDLTTACWALAAALCRDDTFLQSCVQALQHIGTLQALQPQHASNTIWALATLLYRNEPLFEYLCCCVQDRIHEFKPQEMANAIWALATAFFKHETTVLCLCSRVTKTLDQFSCQSTANFVWAYAKLGYSDAPVIEAILKACLVKLDRFSEQDLSTTIWSFSTMLHRDDLFLERWMDALWVKLREQPVKPQHASNMMWSLASVTFYDSTCYSALAQSAVQAISAFSPQDLACCIWACATVVHRDHFLADSVAREALHKLPQFDQQSIGNASWGLAYLNTSVHEVYEVLWQTLANSTCLEQCNEKVVAMVVRAFLRGGRPELAWELFRRMLQLELDPGISALGVWLHDGRHQQPRAVRELEALAVLIRHRPCRQLQVALLNAAALRLEELEQPVEALTLARQLLAQGAGNAITRSLAERLAQEDSCAAEQQLPSVHWPMPTCMRGHACCDYDKQCKLLQHVLATAPQGDPDAIIDAIERFSVDGNGWLKIAGGGKGVVLDELVQKVAPQPVKLVLEFGCFVGYSSTRMARLLRPKGGRVTTVEVDPVHACIARNTLELAGLANTVTICIGYSEDVIPHLRETCKGMPAEAVFFDQRGTRFHIDLQMLEAEGLLKDGCAVLADNVLKPGAPHFLWYLQTSHIYDLTVVSLREFAADRIEDWMALGRYWPTRVPTHQIGIPDPPKALEHLAFLTDRARARSCNADGPCEVSEDAWAWHAQEIRAAYEAVGIRPRIVNVRYKTDGIPFVDW